MKSIEKGMLAPFTIITSALTGILFPFLGSLIALNLKIIDSLYLEGVILVTIGGFIAHWLFAHSIHDIYHLGIEERSTLSKKALKITLIFSIIILLSIAIYLSIYRGWPVMVFAIIGAIMCLYAEGLLHHESQMAFGAMFLIIGSFYVQVKTLNLDSYIWMKVLFIALFAFFSQYGWLLFYRIDDYKWNHKIKIKSILLAKCGIIFLILYFIL